MKITKEYLREKKACVDGVCWFDKTFPDGCTHVELCEKLIDNGRYDWALWFFKGSLSVDNLVKYAIHSAELVLHIYEERHPDNDDPRKAIEAAKKYSNEPNRGNQLAANAAANAAYAAYAVYAVYAVYAAYAAANAAVDAAKKEIIMFGITLA